MNQISRLERDWIVISPAGDKGLAVIADKNRLAITRGKAAEAYGLTIEQLDRGRTFKAARARAVAYWIAKQHGMREARIARAFGKCSSTVADAIEKLEGRMAKYPDLFNKVMEVKRRVAELERA